jgi:hypothetical protein
MALMTELLKGFAQIFSAPFKSLDVFWIILPLLIVWIVLEIYFAKYKKEELGWNTALANGITLGWITLEGLRHLFSTFPDDFWLRLTANIIILLYAVLIIYFSFTHKISSKWDFLLGSPTVVYFIGIFSVLWGYGLLSVTRYVLIDIAVLFAVIVLIVFVVRKKVRPAYS